MRGLTLPARLYKSGWPSELEAEQTIGNRCWYFNIIYISKHWTYISLSSIHFFSTNRKKEQEKNNPTRTRENSGQAALFS